MAGASSSVETSESGLFKISGCNSSSTLLRQQPFDVFINHRGPDVKSNVASPIYHFLELLGVKAFFDREELDWSNLIPQAIQDAMNGALIHIAIFSKGYAESPWCLAELAFMVESGAPIIPVFYDVEPGDLKRGAKKLYDEAFSEHEKSGRYDEATLKSWKSAIHEASSRSGCEFKSNGDIGLYLRKIVERVQKEVKNVKMPFQEVQCPVGLDNAVQNIESIIESAGVRETVQIVGIVGMPGCGKTTLARELYNRKLKTFDKCSFLSEIKEANLSELLKQLLEDILHLGNIPTNDAGRLSSTLARRLRSPSRRVLIVLDDVDCSDQLDALLPERGRSLGSGSLIIVTARDSGLLRNWGIPTNWIHKMRKLEDCHAKKLFCYHAFKGVTPPDAFEGLIDGFVRACDGLPLSLKVIAGMLHAETKEKWKFALDKVSRELPNKIEESLRLSYDALDDEEKNIFLDVACFFAGEKKSLAIAVWDAAGWRDLESLVCKCLVEVDNQSRIRMHNHLRHLGRKIAVECSPHRLWEDGQIHTYSQPNILIRGIMAARTKLVTTDAHDEFPKCSTLYRPPSERRMDLKRLELLVVARNYFTAQFATRSNPLVWLRWFDFQDTNLPSWLSLTNLRVLELYGASKLQTLWANNAQRPEGLRELIIAAREGNSFPSFPSEISGLKYLTKIALISYRGDEFIFTKLPDEFCDLRSLEHLELRYCRKLSKLPTRFGKLRQLRHLDLCYCQGLRRFPDSFKQLINLEYLDLSGCEKLSPTEIPENMVKLEKLYFSKQAKLEELPMQIAEQKSLRELRLEKTGLMVVPGYIEKLSKLETLVIGSPHLTGFPRSFGNLYSLTRLVITRCNKLESLPESVERLSALQYLGIMYSGVRSLPEGFKQLTNLQNLKIVDCPITQLNFWSGSSALSKLKVIHLKGTDVTRLSISQDCCPSLEFLELLQNYSLVEMDVTSESIKMVKVYDCTMLRRINNGQDILNREILKIIRCPEFCPQSTEQFLGKRKRREVLDASESGRDGKLQISSGHFADSQ